MVASLVVLLAIVVQVVIVAAGGVLFLVVLKIFIEELHTYSSRFCKINPNRSVGTITKFSV